MESILQPRPVHPSVVHQPAVTAQRAVSHLPSPAYVLSSDLPESTPKLALLDLDDLAAMPLGTAVLEHHPVSKLLRNPENARRA